MEIIFFNKTRQLVKIIIAHKLKNHDVKSLTKLWKNKTENNQTIRNSANNRNTIVLKYQTDDQRHWKTNNKYYFPGINSIVRTRSTTIIYFVLIRH